MNWKEVVVLGSLVTSAASNLSSAGSLGQMNQQQLEEKVVKEFIQLLRSAVFNLRQTAENVLESEADAPLQTAGAMRILQQRIIDSGLAPDMFLDIPDKEYAAETIKMVTSNSDRLYDGLAPEEQNRVDQVVIDVDQLPELIYYLEHAEKVELLRAAQTTIANATFFGAPGCMPILIYIAIFIASWTCGIMFMTIIGNFAPVIGVLIGMGVALGGTAAVGYLIYRSSGSVGEVNKAKRVVKELEPQIDMARFEKIEKVAQTGADITQMQQEAKERIDSFFGGYRFEGID